MKIVELTGTTDGSGDLTVTSTEAVNGRFVEKVAMDYIDGDTGADITLTSTEAVGQVILVAANVGVADKVWFPRAVSNLNTDGSALASVEGNKIMVTAPLRLVVAQGGASKQIRILVYLSDE